MPEMWPHKSGLGLMEPVALKDHNVAILWSDQWTYKKVRRWDAVPPFQFLNLGAIAANTTGAAVNAVNLELLDDEFGQYRWWVIDNAQVRLWLPAASGVPRLRNLQPVFDSNVIVRDPCLHLTEFFVWEDNRPQFQGINGSNYALAQARLVCQGFRYRVEDLPAADIKEIQAGRKPCVYVQAQGF